MGEDTLGELGLGVRAEMAGGVVLALHSAQQDLLFSQGKLFPVWFGVHRERKRVGLGGSRPPPSEGD